LEWGKNSKFIERQAEKGDKSAQKTLDSLTTVEPYFQDVWNAFNELHRVRQVGFGVGAIAYSDIEAWLNLHNILEYDERLYYFDVIIRVDAEFVTWAREKESQERKKKPPVKGGPKRLQ